MATQPSMRICLVCEGAGSYTTLVPARSFDDFDTFKQVSCGECNGTGKSYNDGVRTYGPNPPETLSPRCF
jgi:hypothetical protein